MKKLTALILAFIMVFAFAACNGNTANTDSEASKPESSANEQSNTPNNSDSAQTNSNTNPSEDNSTDTVKILVAYFSATNTTEGVAKTIADSVNADLYEIVPEQPYTAADLNYNDDNSRSTIEMNNPNARPAISRSVENMNQYDVVFIGYPIWWGDAPRILSTFVESYDFSGKTIVPFCTSGGSGVGSSAKNLERLTSGATWFDGERLNRNASASSISDWIDSLGLSISTK